jgi:hypothetical protein
MCQKKRAKQILKYRINKLELQIDNLTFNPRSLQNKKKILEFN